MKEITVGLPVKVVVDVLRQASKVGDCWMFEVFFFLNVSNNESKKSVYIDLCRLVLLSGSSGKLNN